MMVGMSVVLTGTSYTDKDTTHIGVEFLKGKWKMFGEIWQNLKDDSIGWRLVTSSQHGKQIVLKLCCNWLTMQCTAHLYVKQTWV